MPRDSAVRARSNRNAALIDAMILAASADGSITPLEMQNVLQRVLERPEFEGTRPDELNALIEGSARRLSSAKTLGEIVLSLRERLPSHHNRLLAFGLATAIAFGDRRATREELGLLKTIQAGFGISESEVERLVLAVESGQSLADAVGEPVERCYAEVMVLVSSVDGVVKPEELYAMVENFAANPLFSAISVEQAKAWLREASSALASEGLEKRLTVLAHGLVTQRQRVNAYRLAVQVALADGKAPSATEKDLLEVLQVTFGLGDDEAARIRKES
jgi:tellurite resistance protein